MIITVQTIKREMINDESVKKKVPLKLEVDTSFKAHLKWEKYFQKDLNCDLNTYMDKVAKWTENDDVAKKNFLGILKLLYCYVNAKELPTFEDFCGLFDYEIADEILTEISKVLGEINSTVVKN
ncbi:MAG: hypothetical protein PF487_13370 [Bacteroidales bacterium]|jgi:hypothetical protein|nr:hypothetical protein [Bacteroidales bacterium]